MPGIEAKDLLASLCEVLGVDWRNVEDWDTAYNGLESYIDDVE